MVAPPATENAVRNAEIRECRRHIATWTARLRSLEGERERSIILARLRRDAVKYAPTLAGERRLDPEVLVAAIESANPLPFFKYVAKDNFEEGVRCRPPIDEAPFVPEAVLDAPGPGRGAVVAALMGLPDFREGVEAFISAGHMRVPNALVAEPDAQLQRRMFKIVPRLFEHASAKMKNDKECVLGMIKHNRLGVSSDGARFVPNRMWDDKEILIAFLCNLQSHGVEEKLACVPAQSPLRDDIDVAAAGIVDNSESVFPWLSERLRHSPEVVQMLLDSKSGAEAFRHCSEDVKSDKNLVLRFCQKDGSCLQHASPALRGDEEVVRAACENAGEALEFENAGEALEWATPVLLKRLCRHDPDFIRACIRPKYGFYKLSMLPDKMQCDESLVLEAIGYRRNHIIPEKLNNDKRFWRKALAKRPVMYDSIPEAMKDDYELLRIALMSNAGSVIGEVEWLEQSDYRFLFRKFPQFVKDKELILSILNEGAWHDSCSFDFSFFKTELLKPFFSPYFMDADFWAALCKQDATCYSLAPDDIKQDRKVANAAILGHKHLLVFGELPSWAHLENPKIVCKFFEKIKVNNTTMKEVFDKFAPEVWSDETIARAFAASYQNALLYLPAEYRTNEEVVLAAISKSHCSLAEASPTLRDNERFARLAVTEKHACFGHFSHKLRGDFWLQTLAVASDPEAIHFCGCGGIWGPSMLFGRTEEDAFNSKVEFAQSVRNLIAKTDSFILDFLSGMDIARSPPISCMLTTLAVGVETTLVIKRHIAEYAGVPLGDELRYLIKALENLAVEGF